MAFPPPTSGDFDDYGGSVGHFGGLLSDETAGVNLHPGNSAANIDDNSSKLFDFVSSLKNHNANNTSVNLPTTISPQANLDLHKMLWRLLEQGHHPSSDSNQGNVIGLNEETLKETGKGSMTTWGM